MIRSTARLKPCSVKPETKSASLTVRGVSQLPRGAPRCIDRIRSAIRASASPSVPPSVGSTWTTTYMRPRRLSKTTTSSETISRISGVPSWSGFGQCASLGST